MPDNTPDYSQMRRLLLNAFTTETLRRFCFDRPEFQPIVYEFSPHHGLNDMVDKVLEYLRTRDMCSEFLAAVKEVNPRQYAAFEPYLISSLPIPPHGGGSLTGLIETVIRQARQIHQMGQPDVYTIDDHLALPGSFLLGEDLTLEVELGSGSQQYTLAGHILHHDPPLWLVVELRDNARGEIRRQWQRQGDEAPQTRQEDQILALSQDVAFEILYDLSQPEAGSWLSLKLVTSALGEIQHSTPSDLAPLEKAAATLEEVVAKDPGYRLARYDLGLVYVYLREYQQAIKALKEIQEARDDLYLAVTYNLGIAYYHLFENWAYIQASKQFQAVLDNVEQKMPGKQRRRLQALTHGGLASLCAQQARRTKRGRADLLAGIDYHSQQALELMPEDPQVQAAVHIARGWAHYCQDEREEAIKEFKGAIRLRPTYAETYGFLATSYRAQGKVEEAQEQFQQAVVLNPRYGYAHYQLGEIYSLQGQDDQALDSYRQAPSIPDALNGLGKILAEKKKLYDEALIAFRQAIELNKKLAEAHSNLAWYIVEARYEDEALLEEATEHARRAVQLNRNKRFEWHSLDVLGWVYYHRDMWEQAERELRASIEKGPGKTQNRYHLAKLYCAQGNSERARQALIELFQKTHKKDMWREKAERLMRDLSERASE